jgi:hypothetical protein
VGFDAGTGYSWKLIGRLWTFVAMGWDELESIVCYPSISVVNPVLDEPVISVRKHHVANSVVFLRHLSSSEVTVLNSWWPTYNTHKATN